ncbi:MAG: histidine phosphatase family protein [Anaerolineae bacterium]|nr:histidine phosphatase family protein [Anaerolineae bacterium]
MSNLLYLVRHGENVANLTKEFSFRKVDYSLTARGRLQAEQTGDLFAGKKVDAIYSSPLKRALETAEIISGKIGVPFYVDEAFREINIGALEDMPPTAATWDIHNRIIAEWFRGNHSARFPEGDDYHSLWRRFQNGLERALDGRENQHVMIVGHSGMFTMVMGDFCSLEAVEDIHSVENKNCSITTVEVERANHAYIGRLIRWADADHLHGEAAIQTPIFLEGSVADLFPSDDKGRDDACDCNIGGGF